MPDDVYAISQRFRALLAQRDTRATSYLARLYADVSGRLQQDVEDVLERIRVAEAAGKVPVPGRQTATTFSPSWFFERERLEALAKQAQQQVRFLLEATFEELQREIVAAARLGLEHGGAELRALMGSFARLPAEAIEAMVGNVQAGSPLRDLLRALPHHAGAAVQSALVRGVASGSPARLVAREVALQMGGNFYRASLITRTEMMRSFRQGTLEVYRANADVLIGWRWTAALNGRTCGACWAMHGRIFRLQAEAPGDHPHGRCTLTPVLPDTRAVLPRKEEAWAKLSDVEKVGIVGPTRFRALRDGDITLDNLGRWKTHPRWGRSARPATLKELGIERRPPPPGAPPGPAPKPGPAPGSLPEWTYRRPPTPEPAVRAWRRQKTTARVQEKAQAIWPDKTVDFERLNAESANDFVEAMLKMETDYPSVFRGLRYIGTTQGAGKRFLGPRRTPARAYAYAAESTKVVAINAAPGYSRPKVLSNLRRDVDMKFHPPATDSIEGIMTHEFGHHLGFAIQRGGAYPEDFVETIEKVLKANAPVGATTGMVSTGAPLSWRSLGSSHVRRTVEDGLSRYGRASWDEFFAEAFAEYRLNPNPRAIARAVGEWIDARLKGR